MTRRAPQPPPEPVWTERRPELANARRGRAVGMGREDVGGVMGTRRSRWLDDPPTRVELAIDERTDTPEEFAAAYAQWREDRESEAS